jgi:pimeloyl-ACP methyl ester carboxylesterase
MDNKILTWCNKQIVGLMPLGTSMDSESHRSRALGCWDVSGVTPVIKALTSSTPTSDFELPDDFCNYSISQGFGAECPAETRAQWIKIMKANYQGDAGRKRMREAAVNLRDRDGLHGRLANVKCPVLWLHGDEDVVYSVANAKEEIKLFTGSADAKVAVVKGGHHYLSWTNGEEVDAALTNFVRRVSKETKIIAKH